MSTSERWSEGIGSGLSLIPIPGLKHVGKYGTERIIGLGKKLDWTNGTGTVAQQRLRLDLQFFAGRGVGNRPPNLTPEGAGRNGAFREAKRNSGIPVSQQSKKVTPAVDRRGNKIPGWDYDFGDGKIIRNHSGGHEFPDDPIQNREPHFNDVDGEHYDYSKKRKK